MKKLFDMKIDIELRLFYVLAITACFANTVGFISDIVFFGMTRETIVCGVCAFIMYICAIVGTKGQAHKVATGTILLVINLFEFPFLYYFYGPGRIVFMILGIVGIVAFSDKNKRFIYALIIAIYDAVILIVSVQFPNSIIVYSQTQDLGASIVTFLISAVSISAIIMLILMQYEYQNNELTILTQELKEMANLDPLTKLYNRRYLTQYLDHLMEDANSSFSVVLLDLDDFKQVNDLYGHVYGDEILTKYASLLKECMDDCGIAARFGGEEFMLVFLTNERNKIVDRLSKVQKELEAFSMETKNFRMTFSAGVENFAQEDRITKLFNGADKKLYSAKHHGKNGVVFDDNVEEIFNL